MAPALTPGRQKKHRENQYFDIGVQGRKTGITLKQNERDEHGIERLDGLFSSPAKSPVKPVTRAASSAARTSSSMDIAKSSAPEPTEVLSSRRLLKSSKASFPPPAGRSPYKTNIGSSPRRQSSLAPTSRHRYTPEYDHAQPQKHSVNRRLDFNADHPRQSIEFSPTKPNLRSRRSALPRPDVYDIQATPPKSMKPRPHNPSSEENIDPSLLVVNGYHTDDAPFFMPEQEEEAELPVFETDHRFEDDGEDDEYQPPAIEPEPEPEYTSSPTARRKGKAKTTRQSDGDHVIPKETIRSRSSTHNAHEEREPSKSAEPSVAAPAPLPEAALKKKRGRPKKNPDASIITNGDASLVGDVSVSETKMSKPKGGRKRKVPVYEDEAAVEEDYRPSKRSKATSQAPEERDTNIMAPPKGRSKKGSRSPSRRTRSPSRKPAFTSTLTVLREQTPADMAGFRRTRSGRQVFKPADFWLGEKVHCDIHGNVQEVIRAESVPVEPRRRGRAPGKKRAPPAHREASMSAIDEDDEEEEEQEEDWEAEGLVWRGPVKTWDPIASLTLDIPEKEQDLALSAKSIEQSYKDVQGRFKFAKILSLLWFGSGVVSIPPGGGKDARSSKGNQMVFFVHTGKVTVTVEQTEFTVSKGSIWHVPRGNCYSIANHGSTTANVFYAQANVDDFEQRCEPRPAAARQTPATTVNKGYARRLS